MGSSQSLIEPLILSEDYQERPSQTISTMCGGSPGQGKLPPPGAAPVLEQSEVSCHACGNVIVGLRFKCLDCRDVDLCSQCFPSGKQRLCRSHRFHKYACRREPTSESHFTWNRSVAASPANLQVPRSKFQAPQDTDTDLQIRGGKVQSKIEEPTIREVARKGYRIEPASAIHSSSSSHSCSEGSVRIQPRCSVASRGEAGSRDGTGSSRSRSSHLSTSGSSDEGPDQGDGDEDGRREHAHTRPRPSFVMCCGACLAAAAIYTDRRAEDDIVAEKSGVPSPCATGRATA